MFHLVMKNMLQNGKYGVVLFLAFFFFYLLSKFVVWMEEDKHKDFGYR